MGYVKQCEGNMVFAPILKGHLLHGLRSCCRAERALLLQRKQAQTQAFHQPCSAHWATRMHCRNMPGNQGVNLCQVAATARLFAHLQYNLPGTSLETSNLR
jgi:hypothetical protein